MTLPLLGEEGGSRGSCLKPFHQRLDINLPGEIEPREIGPLFFLCLDLAFLIIPMSGVLCLRWRLVGWDPRRLPEEYICGMPK